MSTSDACTGNVVGIHRIGSTAATASASARPVVATRPSRAAPTLSRCFGAMLTGTSLLDRSPGALAVTRDAGRHG
jgi:hypothetical protein